MMKKFDLELNIAAAEAGDSALWEDIARHLLTTRKPAVKRTKKATGERVWAFIQLADRRSFLVSTYGADLRHASEYAQHRARMEDSGDGGGTIRVMLNHSIKMVPVASAEIVPFEYVEAARKEAYEQRAKRHGWAP